jgi:PAS domain S-box-containing protein
MASSRLFDAVGLCAHLLLTIFAVLLCALTGSEATEQPTAKNVLVLSGGHGHVSIDLMEATLRPHVPWPVNFTVLDLETPSEAESFRESQAEALRASSGQQKPDLVIAVMDRSLLFALQYRDKAFPGVPIVFMSVGTPSVADQKSWHGVTGVACASGIPETIDLALRLHPDTNTIAVITDVSQWEKNYFAAVHSELLRHQDKVREIDLIGSASGQMLERVAALPPHTVVLFQLIQPDVRQPAFGAWDLLAAVAQRLPTYSWFAQLSLDHGGIGGAYYDWRKDAASAGEIAARVLSGERPDDIPYAQDSPPQVTVDWRQLHRWHIPESALPPGTLVLYREPTLWARAQKYAFAAIVVIALQAVWITALLLQRARKRKAEAVLRESEKRFRVMADTTPSLIWMCDEEGKIIYLNDRRITFTGSDPGTGYDNAWTEYVHPDDLESIEDALSLALKSHQPLTKEYRLRRRDGVYRWIFDVASPRVNGDGSFAGLIGSGIDITDQKLAQQALQTVGGRLLEAQDEERKRIARELHDDISQKLALLSMELAQANRSANGSVEATKERLNEIRQHCSEIAKDIQSLSHQLHYSKLDYLGLVGALKGFCRDFAKQYDVSVEFEEENVPRQLPRQISLCLFRVTQEALHNAVKYSGTQEYIVRLSATQDKVELVITDAGAGFDVAEVTRNQGLGLVSMEERVHLVQGRFNIESKPGKGTEVVVSVPLIAGAGSAATGADQPASVQGAA